MQTRTDNAGGVRGERILITGGGGAIGSQPRRPAGRQAGAQEVVVLDNFVRGRRENLELGAGQRHRSSWSRATSATATLVRELTRGIDVVFHQAAMRITQCAEEPRLALEVLVDGTFNVVEAAVARGRAQGRSPPRRPRSTAWPSEFPTTEDHHPYANDTLYGAAKVFNEGLLRSFHAMTGLDYVALRYFNVYGPRMDIHGVYTEVLVRWMERIAAGQPPLILGDGTQTMDFVFIGDIARANVLAAQADVTDEVFNVASGVETSLHELAQMLLKVMGSDLEHRVRPRAHGQRRHAPAGRHQPRARAAGLRAPRSTSRRASRAWSRGGAPSCAPDGASALAEAS